MCKIVWKSLIPRTRSRNVSVEEILEMAFGAELSISFTDKAMRSRFFNGGSVALYRSCMHFFLSKSNAADAGHPFTYGTFPPWLDLQNAWKKITDSMEKKESDAFKEQILNFLESLQPKEQNLLSYQLARISEAVRNEPLEMQLATLSMIACTWGVWESAFKKNSRDASKSEQEICRLALLILPEGVCIQTTLPTAPIDQALEEDRADDTEQAQASLAQVRVLVRQHRYQEAGEACEEIIQQLTCAPDILRGEACYLLACCCRDDPGSYKLPKSFCSVEELLLLAKQFGYDHNAACDRRILSVPRRSSDSRKGVCVCNAHNDAGSWLESTMPAGWEMKYSSSPSSFVHSSETVRFALLDEDLEKNVRDALQILGTIQQTNHWKHSELFIRCEEEKTSPLLDTALSFLRSSWKSDDACPVQVYLLDEAKHTAQSLYARHPLFYPFSLDPDSKHSDPLHLVILSSAPNTSFAAWLVREASWLLPVLPDTHIKLLSPCADKIRSHIGAACPGLAEQITFGREKSRQDRLSIKGIKFPEMEFIEVDFESPQLSYALQQIEKRKGFKYYVVDAGSDLETIALGTRVRESNIRRAVEKRQIDLYSRNRAVIALRCTSPHMAHLAQELLVPKEKEPGNQWFNNYGFTTFGALDELYSWDNLDGGVFEEAAQCLHLMYCGSAFRPEEKRTREKDLDSYFQSLYNQDSSRAAVIGFPYRLFRAGIVAPCWYIQDPDAYWSEPQRLALADRLQRSLAKDKNLLSRLAQYEHTRWTCYLISRGWLGFSDSDQVVQIIKAGAPKHMLQIARLHACICSWDDLKALQSSLDWAYRNERTDGLHSLPDDSFSKYYDPKEKYTYFQHLDDESIRKTPQVLRTEWLAVREEEREEYIK